MIDMKMTVRIYFDNGPSMKGEIDMRDLFNADRFITFERNDEISLLNKDHIVQVEQSHEDK